MKKVKFLIAIGLGISIASCSNSLTEDFEEQNQDATEKRLKSVTAKSIDNNSESAIVDFIYDGNLKLEKVIASNMNETTSINYSNDGEVINVNGNNNINETLNVSELYQAPYDIYREGTVAEYDDNRNPSKIIIHREEIIYSNGNVNTVIRDYTAEINYDNSPNLFFYTLKSAGVIDILDNVDLNIGINMQSTEMVKARNLFPMNNPTKMTFKDENGNITETVILTHEYDNDNYPIKTNITSLIDNQTTNNEVVYTYY